ncbi:MAG: FAD-dependent oxidoreductase [Ruminococcaceae bacterium]|nr:FAD-dependent oxidoreductase [Oscillospiraceae bacterium]
MRYDLVVIGGGPAGIAAAEEAKKNGAGSVLIIEREKELGGILNQCIHSGFGIHIFKEQLSGPEYAKKFIDLLPGSGIEIKTDTTVIGITPKKIITAVSAEEGFLKIEAGAIILAMGCRERTRSSIAIPGERPSGIFTAGTAQKYINVEGYMVGKKVLILGSGDIGLIMARRMTLEGAKVEAVVEIMPHSNGLKRNIAQCLDDYGIPLYLSHTVTDIKSENGRLSKVIVSKVEGFEPIPGTEIEFEVDTLLLSVGLVPENELSRKAGILLDSRTNGAVVDGKMMTSVPGIFACGNVLHVHDLVDFVTSEAQKAGKAAAEYLSGKISASSENIIDIETGDFVGYTVPQKIDLSETEKFAEIFFRVKKVLSNAKIVLSDGSGVVLSKKREQMLPAEMEKLIVPKKILEEAKGKKLFVSVREGGEND